MKAISLSHPIFSACHHHNFSHTIVLRQLAKRCVVNAGKGANDKSIVDESMIVLRVRIKEVEMEETDGLASTMFENWMEWEKKYYERYNKDVYEAIGMLQMCLMNTRPSFALGALALLMISVPLSTSVVIYHFLKLAKLLL